MLGLESLVWLCILEDSKEKGPDKTQPQTISHCAELKKLKWQWQNIRSQTKYKRITSIRTKGHSQKNPGKYDNKDNLRYKIECLSF